MIHGYHVAHKTLASRHSAVAHPAMPDAQTILQGHARLRNRLVQYFRSLPLLFSDVRATEPSPEGVDIWVDSHLDAVSVQNLVSSLLADVNDALPGLNLTASPSESSGLLPPQGR